MTVRNSETKENVPPYAAIAYAPNRIPSFASRLGLTPLTEAMKRENTVP